MPFGIGPAELILILIVALVVFGPRRLPELGGSLGKAIREFRRASSELTREIEDDIRPRPGAAPALAQPPGQQATEITCAHCGSRSANGNKFCGSCGQSLVRTEA